MTADSDLIARLCDIVGVEPGYHDVGGGWHAAGDATRGGILNAAGIRTDGHTELLQSLEQMTADTVTRIIDPVLVVDEGSGGFEIVLYLSAHTAGHKIEWRIDCEDGSLFSGTVSEAHGRAVGELHAAGRKWRKLAVYLSVALPLGYHRLRIENVKTAYGEYPSAAVICVPRRCHLPDELWHAPRNTWGVSLQLYSLRSSRNWGFGDFMDLRAVADQVGGAGASFIGLNPLHALNPGDRNVVSPYSPTSRSALNILYLALDQADDFRDSEECRKFWGQPELAQRVAELRGRPALDYVAVARLKLEALRHMYCHFRAAHLQADTDRGRRFAAFVQQGGSSLQSYALFQALWQHFARQDPPLDDWQAWPAEFRRPDAAGALAFAREHGDAVTFVCYCEWLAQEQLASAAAYVRERGLRYGLYADLAIGTSLNAAEVWANQELYALSATMGAPPDAFNARGQAWPLTPFIPHRLRQQAFAPFIEVLRANMRHAAMIRIDHVMMLMRMFWVPAGMEPSAGMYVRSPLRELSGILALESRRNQCVVIGEDLGTVPDNLRQMMQERGMLSYKVFLFMRGEHGNVFPRESYQRPALVAASIHDLPTLTGFWTGHDLEQRRRLGHFGNDGIYQEHRRYRERDRWLMRDAFLRVGLTPDSAWDMSGKPEGAACFVRLVYEFLARTGCLFKVVQLEDLLLHEQQMNMPGTLHEYPNWRIRLEKEIAELCDSDLAQAVMRALRG